MGLILLTELSKKESLLLLAKCLSFALFNQIPTLAWHCSISSSHSLETDKSKYYPGCRDMPCLWTRIKKHHVRSTPTLPGPEWWYVRRTRETTRPPPSFHRGAREAHVRQSFACGHGNCRCSGFQFYVQQLGWEARCNSAEAWRDQLIMNPRADQLIVSAMTIWLYQLLISPNFTIAGLIPHGLLLISLGSLVDVGCIIVSPCFARNIRRFIGIPLKC